MLRYDVLDRPLGSSALYWGLGSSLGYLNRSEPLFHSRNVGRLDFYPHLSAPFEVGGWSIVPEGALRTTAYTISHTPDLSPIDEIPTISHDPIDRKDLEASIDIRPPALEREFEFPKWHRIAPRNRTRAHLQIHRWYRGAGTHTCCSSTLPIP